MNKPTILCFNWNTDNTPLCEKYYNNKSTELIKKGFQLTKRENCFNPLFFDNISVKIKQYSPDIVIIVTEGDVEDGTYFHSDFLPDNMKFLGYKLLARDKYKTSNGVFSILETDTVIRMSIFVKYNDNNSSILDLRHIVFKSNGLTCNIKGNQPIGALVLYVNTSFGEFAFVGVNLHRNNAHPGVCLKWIHEKLIQDWDEDFDEENEYYIEDINKNFEYSFIMGDFANDDNFTLEEYNNKAEMQDILKNSSYLKELDYKEYENYNQPNYNLKQQKIISNKLQFSDYEEPIDRRNIKSKNKTQLTERNANKTSGIERNIGWHDRIFHHAVNNNLVCVEYETVLNSPMLKTNKSHHAGILGIYQVVS